MPVILSEAKNILCKVLKFNYSLFVIRYSLIIRNYNETDFSASLRNDRCHDFAMGSFASLRATVFFSLQSLSFGLNIPHFNKKATIVSSFSGTTSPGSFI